jgi:hypothetical protein
VDEDTIEAEGHRDCEQALLAEHCRKAPPRNYEPSERRRAFEQINAEIFGKLLGKAADSSEPRDDRISAEILNLFWDWDHQPIAQLVRAYLWIGHLPRFGAENLVLSTPRTLVT